MKRSGAVTVVYEFEGGAMSWAWLRVRFRLGFRFPIVSDLVSASWPNWRDAIKELFVILFFSLMPLWLGMFIVTILTITGGTPEFIKHFASSSDLGILSASLLGPLLYMMFREEGQSTGNRVVPSFPSGLWFVMLILACCMIATVIYCFTYLSGTRVFYEKDGTAINFINAGTVEAASWILFATVVILILVASTIRNSAETQPPRMMSDDTQNYVDRFKAAQPAPSESDITAGLAAAQGEGN